MGKLNKNRAMAVIWYLPSLVQSQIDWHDMSGHTDWIVFVTESTSVDIRTCLGVPSVHSSSP